MILVLDVTDPTLPLLRDEFVSPLVRMVTPSVPVITVHLSDLKCPEPVSGVIICGTALADTWYLSGTVQPVLTRWNVPILGICAGMQMLLAENGTEPVPSLEIGMIPVRVTDHGRNDPLVCDRREFSGYALHQYTREVPCSWTILACSEAGPQIVRHVQHPWYGILFHPEVRNEWIIERFLAMCHKPVS